jgi:glycosyltransferase involved in cell wall biosynthesis
MIVKKKLKVLYVCPFAHHTGHFSWAAIHETEALAQTGIEVDLLSFCGVTDQAEVKVPASTVLQHAIFGNLAYHLANFFRKWGITTWLSMFVETAATLTVAIRLKGKLGYDIIHLRDGEPFLFLPHLLSLGHKDYNWIISLTGSSLVTLASYPSSFAVLKEGFRPFLYAIYIRTLTGNLWRPLYRRSLARNHFIFLTQNDEVKQSFESFAGGVLAGKVLSLPLGVNATDTIISRKEARTYLGLPLNKPVFLSFGFLHEGKDMLCIFKALKDIPEAFLLHGGDQRFRLHLPNSTELMQQYNMQDRTIIRDYYIPEQEKPYYFFAADAVILSYTKQFLSTTSLLWQACRFGTPVIASDNGQLGELIQKYHTGLHFKAQDASSLGKAIIQFINLKPLAIKAMKDNCCRFCSEFSLKSWASKCHEIYNKLLAGRSQLV